MFWLRNKKNSLELCTLIKGLCIALEMIGIQIARSLVTQRKYIRVTTSSGNHGKPLKLLKKKFHAWKNHGI